MPKSTFLSISHRGFGMRAYPRYQKDGRFGSVSNSLTGMEIGVEIGANTLELDLSKTTDGHIVTAHGMPFRKDLGVSLSAYLRKYPEALTLSELFDWLMLQEKEIYLYLELKSSISIEEVVECIGPEREIIYGRVMLYSHKSSYVQKLLREKDAFGLVTNELRVWCTVLPLVTTRKIDELAKFGTATSRLYGIEQGMIPWGLPLFIRLPRLKKYFSSISKIADYAHGHNLRFIIGTIDDPKRVAYFREHNVDGVVPNSPAVFFGKPAEDVTSAEYVRGYIPESMRRRLR